MSSQQPQQPKAQLTFACAILRRDGEFLIVRPHGTGGRAKWAFPAGAVEAGESPEAACRRVCLQSLGIEIGIEFGQPPLSEQVGEQTVLHRYFFCYIEGGALRNLAYAEVRWVLLGQLPDYEFDPVTGMVVEWLLKNY